MVGRGAGLGGRADHPHAAPHDPGDAGRWAGLLAAGEETERTGVPELPVATDGTVREWRGAADALLAHVLAAGAAAGYTRSSSTVDTADPTGALGVHARAGYTPRRRRRTWTDPTTGPA